MRILVTGSQGFIGKNLIVRLRHEGIHQIETFDRNNEPQDLREIVESTDMVFHLAGENRPKNDDDFDAVNNQLTKTLCEELAKTNRQIPIIFTSSTQATLENPYGKSKLLAEQTIEEYAKKTGSNIHIFRLTNVFGKWSKPNYNSVVSTFCYNIANDLPISIDESNKLLRLIYIDDVIESFLDIVRTKGHKGLDMGPVYEIKLGELAELISSFEKSRDISYVDDVGVGLTRALYSTYLSYFNTDKFSYKLDLNTDDRGGFSEFLKTKSSGQISFFTINPGYTRGGHYHHTKNEKFLVIQGKATFRFRNIINDEIYEYDVSSDLLEVVETIPGWAHDISNQTDKKTIVLLWANEIFDSDKPDTYSSNLEI